MHYTGPAADELDLLLGGRTTHNEVINKLVLATILFLSRAPRTL